MIYTFCAILKGWSVSLCRRADARNVRLCYLFWQHTDLFISLITCSAPSQDKTYLSKYKKVGVLRIWIAYYPFYHTPTFIYFDLYPYSAYAAHYVWIILGVDCTEGEEHKNPEKNPQTREKSTPLLNELIAHTPLAHSNN